MDHTAGILSSSHILYIQQSSPYYTLYSTQQQQTLRVLLHFFLKAYILRAFLGLLENQTSARLLHLTHITRSNPGFSVSGIDGQMIFHVVCLSTAKSTRSRNCNSLLTDPTVK